MKKTLKKIYNIHPLYWYKICSLQNEVFESKQDIDKKGIALVWFSYAGDFDLLSSSIISADIFSKKKIQQLIIVQDISSPFSNQQKKKLLSLTGLPLAIIDSAHPMSWAGISTIASEVKAYQEIFSKFNIEWLVKLDSDALAISNKIFTYLDELPKNTAFFVGQSSRQLYKNNKTAEKIDWAQGGCYCFNYEAFCGLKNASLPKAVINTLKCTDLSLKYLPEDVFFTQYFTLAKAKITLLRFHYPIWFRKDLYSPKEFDDSEDFYSVLHFEGCKKHQVSTLSEISELDENTLIEFLNKKWQSSTLAVT